MKNTKKYIFYTGVSLFLLLIFLIILIFNLNFLGNHPFFRKKIIDYIKLTYNSNLNYGEFKLDPFKKRLVLRDLYLESSNYSLSFSKAIINFSLIKFLQFNLVPSKIYFKDFNLKLPYVKEEEKKEKKPLVLENILEYFYSLGPVSVFIKKGNIEKETSYGIFKLSLSQGEAQIKDRQMEIKIKGSYSLNLHKRLIKENEDIRKLEGGLEVLGLTKERDFKIEFPVFKINHPQINGKGEWRKDSQGYFFSLSLDRIDLLDLKKIFKIFLAKDKTFQYLEEVVQGGVAYGSILKSSGKSFKELVFLPNLYFETHLKNGELELKKPPLSLKNIEGKLYLKKAFLNFEGEALLNENIPSQIENFSLNFNKAPLELSLKTSFEGESRDLIDIAISTVEALKVLRDYEIEGKVKGELELKGTLANLEPIINLDLYEIKLKTPFYSKPLIIKNGNLKYQSFLVAFKNWKLALEDSLIENLEGNWNIKNSFLNLAAKNVWLSNSFLADLEKKNLLIREIVSKYNLQTKGILLDWLSYRGSFLPESLKENPQVLMRNFFIQGRLIELYLEVPYKKEKFFLESQKLNFTYDRGKTILENSLVYVDKIPFEVSGLYEEDFWNLKIKGEIKEGLKTKFLKGLEWDKSLILGDSIILKDLELKNQKGSLTFKGESTILDKVLSFKGKYGGPENYVLESRFKGESSDLNLILKKEKYYEMEIDGFLELSEIKPLLLGDQTSLEGKVRSQLHISFSQKDLDTLKENLKNLNFKELIQTYLISDFFSKIGLIKVENLKYFEKDNFLELSSQFLIYPSEIQLEELNFKWNALSLKGKLNLSKEKGFLTLKGFLESSKMDLKKGIIGEVKPEKEGRFNWDEILKLPLIVNLELDLKNILLPTAHLISESKVQLSFTSEKILTLKIPVIDICGLKIEGFYERNPEIQYLFMELLPSTGDFLDFFSCLYPEEMPRIILEGPFKTKGFFYTDGKKGILVDTYGELEVTSTKGYLYRAPLIARVLGFLSPIDIFRGKVPNLENNLLEYDELKLIAYFEDTSFKVDTGFLSALGFRLFSSGSVSLLDKKTNLTFYVSPFKTVDMVIEKIPFFNQRLLGKPRMLIFVPLQVIGTYDSPVIVPLHPSSLGKGIFTFLFRFLGIDESFYKPTQIPEKLKKMEIFKEKIENNLRR